MTPHYDYSVITGDKLGEQLARELAGLFSSAYGKWSRRSPLNAGRNIRLGARYYLENYSGRQYRIATCRDGGRLIAQAVYLERKTPRGDVSLVVQLVVDGKYRRQGVATTLLHAIWGFSDFYAWGIVTSSPCTVEALEAATFRRCDAGRISKNARFVAREVFPSVPFLAKSEWRTDGRSSVVDTRFFTDRTSMPVARRRVEGRLGRIAEGEEWLAFTFRDQPLDLVDAYSQVIECSGRRFVKSVFRLSPSHVMATTGEFLSAKGTLRDPGKGLYYHKEQFTEGEGLPGEYLVVDRRYRAGAIESLVSRSGLRVVMRHYVRAGFGEALSEREGKEILLIAKKETNKRRKTR